MRVYALIVAVAAGTLLLVPAGGQEGEGPSKKPRAEQSADKVKDLQKERLATLKTVAEMEAELYKIGQGTTDAMLEARVLVAEAELEAAEKESDRVAVLKNLVETLKACEETAKARKVAAAGTEAEVLRAKARRLAAQIRLEQAQARAPAKGNGAAKQAEPKQERIVVTSPQAKDVVVAEQFTCQIRARRHIDVRSQQSGYIESVHVQEGQAVKQGDVLFKVAPQLFKAKLDTELAEVEIAALNLRNAERLFQSKTVSAEEVALAKARLASAQAKAELAKAELDLTIIRAPFDGLIGRVQQQPGSLVTERDILTTLSDNSVMCVYFQVPEARYLEFLESPTKDRPSEAELVLSGGRKFKEAGKIAGVGTEFDSDTGSIPFRADFPNPEGRLRHGMSGTLLLPKTLASAIVIPQRAVFASLGTHYVYVVDKDNVAHQREIVIRCELADTLVIHQGLDPSDRIVVEGIRQIRDGEKVEYELQRP